MTTRGAGPLVRWSAAAIAIFYGFAKLNGAQFTVLESELDRPLREVSGFWLTWYYFGYSWVYGNLIALAQIIAGLCLTQERLALAGALLLLPIAANIVLVDIFYGVDAGGLMAAAVLLVLVVSIIWPYRTDLIRVVLGPGRPTPDRLTAVFPALVLCLVAFSVTYWIAHHNNRAPTAIDGVWEVEPGTTPHEIERVYFERNRAHLAVFRDTSGDYRRHHFELAEDGRVKVWLEWLDKGGLVYYGLYLQPDMIVLYPPTYPAASLRLTRRDAGRD
ncbi:MAG TPA: hypothetical protein VK912_06635 [Longimicrobiales bacterium]|nr:hypothetical protein [Longimicrobiales bacterium]